MTRVLFVVLLGCAGGPTLEVTGPRNVLLELEPGEFPAGCEVACARVAHAGERITRCAFEGTANWPTEAITFDMTTVLGDKTVLFAVCTVTR